MKKFSIAELSNNLQNSCKEINFAFLFGSAKDGVVNDNSDIDVAVHLNCKLSLPIISNIAGTVEKSTKAECDLTILNTASSILSFEALNGVELFVRDTALEDYLDFYVHISKRYEEDIFWLKKNGNTGKHKMKFNGIIEKKLILLENKLSEIEDWNIVDLHSFEKSTLQINAVERALTVCVEIMIDISSRIIAIEKIGPTETSFDKFKQLEKIHCIAKADTYADMIKFRNFIVHRYENIEIEILFNIVRFKLSDFRRFIEEIRAFCNNN